MKHRVPRHPINRFCPSWTRWLHPFGGTWAYLLPRAGSEQEDPCTNTDSASTRWRQPHLSPRTHLRSAQYALVFHAKPPAVCTATQDPAPYLVREPGTLGETTARYKGPVFRYQLTIKAQVGTKIHRVGQEHHSFRRSSFSWEAPSSIFRIEPGA